MKKIGLVDMYTYLPILALIVGIFVVFFANDTYRYPCQDPANWENADCQPPACTASSSCPANLITLDGTPVSPEQMQSMIDDIKATEAAIESMTPAETEVTPTETPLYEEVK